METKAFFFRSWDDLVFENRNQTYGAYVIRRAYSRRVILGWGVSTALVALLIFISGITPDNVKEVVKPFEPGGIVRVLPPPPIPQRRQIQRVEQPVNQVRQNTTIRVVTEPVETPVEDIEPEPYIEPTAGVGNGGGAEGLATGTTNVPIVAPVTGPVVVAEVMPVYEGGTEAMMKFIRKHIRYPGSARRIGTDGTVFVSFVVNGDGKVTDVMVLRGIHPDCDKEAVRVIGMLSKWAGGRQNGMPVAVKMVLPIKFALEK